MDINEIETKKTPLFSKNDKRACVGCLALIVIVLIACGYMMYFYHSNYVAKHEELAQREYADSISNNNNDFPISDSEKEFVGIWKVSQKEFPNPMYIEIFKGKGEYWEESYDEGSSAFCQTKLIKKGNTYRDPEDKTGEYYVIKSGKLRFCNENGDFTDEMGYRIKKVR